MKKEYYNPDIEDLYIGYECEVNSALGHSDIFIPTVINYKFNKSGNSGYTYELSDLIIMIDDGYGEIRTPYLSKEQIINEGFEWDKNMSEIDYDVFNYELDYDSQYEIRYYYNTNTLIIEHIYIYAGEGTLFKGKCKSINEFKKIIKFLDIK